MRDGEPNMYTALATMRNGYVQGQSTRLQLFLAFNVVAMPIVIASTQPLLVKTLVGFAGLFIHYAVILGVSRANRWTAYFDERMKALEELDAESDSNGARVKVFSDPKFESMRRSWLATRYSFVPLAFLAVGFWVSNLGYNAYLLLK